MGQLVDGVGVELERLVLRGHGHHVFIPVVDAVEAVEGAVSAVVVVRALEPAIPFRVGLDLFLLAVRDRARIDPALELRLPLDPLVEQVGLAHQLEEAPVHAPYRLRHVLRPAPVRPVDIVSLLIHLVAVVVAPLGTVPPTPPQALVLRELAHVDPSVGRLAVAVRRQDRVLEGAGLTVLSQGRLERRVVDGVLRRSGEGLHAPVSRGVRGVVGVDGSRPSSPSRRALELVGRGRVGGGWHSLFNF